MDAASTHDVTGWLRAWGRGDDSPLEKLAPFVYAEPSRRARRLMGRARVGHSLLLRDFRMAKAWLHRELTRGSR